MHSIKLSDGVQLTIPIRGYFADLVRMRGPQNTRWPVRKSAGPQITCGLFLAQGNNNGLLETHRNLPYCISLDV